MPNMTPNKFGSRTSTIIFTALLCFFSVAALAQGGTVTERRIRFARGRTTAVEKGAIAYAHSDVYTLGARRGQTMSLHIASANRQVVFSLTAPSGTPVEGAFTVRDWSGELPESGDYTITVVNNREHSAASAYTLEVTIR
ncbi:MAG: hypothetical protein DMF66_01740 [Acidobacteria bacterium]|nr:MAG: hypothetical protein DMF66_01740 [Acidobacteriota bacterium]